MIVHMYYLMMNTVVKPTIKFKTFCSSKSYIPLKDKDNYLTDLKFYQKLFIVLISLSTFLIFPELPRELENICESYNSRKSCNVW